MILLDTNVISELRKNRPHGAVLSWFHHNPLPSLCLSAVTIYELQAGAERTRLADRAKAEQLDQWIAALETSIRVLDFRLLEGKLTAHLFRGKSLDLFADAMIAATALAYNIPLATRNTRDFATFNVPLINPFTHTG